MTEMKKINEMELENVAGGDRRIVNTGMKLDAVVRSGAGFKFPQIFSVKNGNAVITTGNKGNTTIQNEKKGGADLCQQYMH